MCHPKAEEKMSLSKSGPARIPPGFRFHPTEEELLQYYLRKKVANEKIDMDVILEIDLNKFEPWDIEGDASIKPFFTHQYKNLPFSHMSYSSLLCR